jgi:Tfp pilus assembly protein PilF
MPHADDPLHSPRRTLILLMLLLAGVAGGGALYYAFEPDPPPEETAEPRRPLTPGEQAASRVMQLAMQGAVDRAIDLGQSYVRQHPNDTDVRVALAQIHARHDRTDRAETLVHDVLEIDPTNPRACWLKGLLHIDQPDVADTWFAKAATQDRAGPEIWGDYGLWLARRNLAKPARQWLRRAIDADSQQASVYREAGKLAWADGQKDQAMTWLERAVSMEIRDPRNHAALADAQIRSGQYDAAAETLQAGMDASSGADRTMLQLQLAEALELAGKHEKAAAEYAEVASSSRMTMEGLVGAARCYYRAGQYAKAMNAIDTAYEIDRQSAEIRSLRKKIEDARFVKPGGMLDFDPDIDGDGTVGGEKAGDPDPLPLP